MGWFQGVVSKFTSTPVGPTVPTVSPLQQEAERQEGIIADLHRRYLEERLAELEMALETQGWQRQFGGEDWEITREFLDKIIRFARMMYFKNPLIKRAVSVQSYYTYALGVQWKAVSREVQEVINDFMLDPRNKPVIANHVALLHLDASLSTDGQLFFVFYPNKTTGRTRIRVLPIEQITDIILNPEDRNDPWFYRRKYTVEQEGQQPKTIECLHPRTGLVMVNGEMPVFKGIEVRWNQPVYHAKGPCGLTGMKWAIPEIYAALDWAMAVKNFLEDWLTVIKAYARVAMQMSGFQSKEQLAAARSKMGVTNADNSQIGGAAGQVAFTGSGVELKAVKTAGATTSTDEGRQVKLMVAAATDLPETFFGDADVGNFATAETLDRPTEFKMKSRQLVWSEIFGEIFRFVILRSAEAAEGKLRAAGFVYGQVQDESEEMFLNEELTVPTTEEGTKSADVAVKFTDIIERNVDERVRALVGAFTMNGRPFHTAIDDPRLVADLILEAIGVKDREEILDRLYPVGSSSPKLADLSSQPQQPIAEDPVGPTGSKSKGGNNAGNRSKS